jgi:gamma-D-glutamyl-L-lysine dipeptidyl-peptidase
MNMIIENIQELIQDFPRKQADKRLDVFLVDIKSLDSKELVLDGRVLEAANLQALKEAISKQYPRLRVDSSGVQILRQPGNPILAVGSNLTSLHTATSFLAEMSSQMVFGEKVEVLEEQGRWVYIRQMDGYLGWTYKPYLTDVALPKPTHIVLAPAVELRAEADTRAPILSRSFCGTRVKVEATKDGWAQVAANVTGWMPLADLRALSALPKTVEARRKQIVIDAQRMIGVPYLWGGTTGNGIDCSGFARLLHHWVGIELPRDSDMQSAQSKRVEPPYQPGDLFFFGDDNSTRHITHVGISMGGYKMIHSSGSRNGVYLDDLQEKESLRSIFIHAGTFIGK